jgi:ATP/maltotriose-dependent transcriptional regulator MalT
MQGFGQCEGFGAGPRLTDDAEIVLGVDHAAQPLADDRVVVNEQHCGMTALAPSVADRLVRFVRQPTSVTLSTREVEVLALVAKGQTNAAIGRELHISEATVKTHLLRAFNKLGVSDRTAAVTTAMSLGLLREQ